MQKREKQALETAVCQALNIYTENAE